MPSGSRHTRDHSKQVQEAPADTRRYLGIAVSGTDKMLNSKRCRWESGNRTLISLVA